MSTDLVGLITDLERNMSQVVLGKLDVIRMCLVALLALTSCGAKFNRHRIAIDEMHADGRFDLVDDSLSDPDVDALYMAAVQVLTGATSVDVLDA